MVYLEQQLVKPANVDERLDSYLIEKQYQTFLDWWRKNSEHFSTLSFNTDNQAQQFINDLENDLDFDTSFLKIRSDLWGYYLEYIKQESFLPFANLIKDGRLVGDFYGDKPIVDLVDEAEREGATRKAMEDLEEKLKIIQPEQMVFRVSPKGWTNMGYDYTETQFQVYWQDNQLIRGLTIRTGIDLDKIIELFRDYLRIEFDPKGSEKDLLKKITATNVILEDVSLDDVIEMIIEVSRDSDHQGRPLKDQYKQWKVKDSNYQRYDQLVELLNFLELKIKISVDKKSLAKEELESLLAFALMAMGENELREKIQAKEILRSGHSFSYYSDSFYSLFECRYLNQVFSYLKSLPGCAGGGLDNQFKDGELNSNFSKLTPFGVVNLSSEENDNSTLKCVTCPFCSKTVDAEIIDKNGKKMIHCPRCGAEAEYEESVNK